MTLYDHPDCPYGMKVRIVLAEKDMDCEMVTVDMQSGQHRQPEFLKLNPFGRVPVLVDEGCVIYDSTIINEYLDDEYPEPALRPADSDERARVRLLEDYADTAFTLPAMALQNELAKAAGTRDESRVKAARDVVVKALEMLNRELEGKAYLGGEEFSLADVAFAPMVLQLEKLGVHLDNTLKNVKAWAQRLAARPSVAKVPRLVA
jgi:glutathione S-transferase